jgi:hypothetical protein
MLKTFENHSDSEDILNDIQLKLPQIKLLLNVKIARFICALKVQHIPKQLILKVVIS